MSLHDFMVPIDNGIDRVGVLTLFSLDRNITSRLSEKVREMARRPGAFPIAFAIIWAGSPELLDGSKRQEIRSLVEDNCGVPIYDCGLCPTTLFPLGCQELTIDRAEQYTNERVKLILNNWDQSLRSGLEELVSTHMREILVAAPGGTYFAKPSGNGSNYFLRAEGALRSRATVQFLGLAIATLFFKNFERTINAVYIDSMLIYPVVSHAIDFLYRSTHSPNNSPIIESFHSYEGIQEFSFPLNTANAVTLGVLSASTSGGLARTFAGCAGVPIQQVFTLFCFSDNPIEKLCPVQRPDDFNKVQPTTNLEKVPIVVTGEYFLPSPNQCRKVEILKAHGASLNSKRLLELTELYSVETAAKPLHACKDYRIALIERTSGVDGSEIQLPAGVKTWLNMLFRVHLPGDISHVVHEIDLISWSLAKYVKETLQISNELIASTNLESLDRGSLVGGVIVLSGCISDGNTFVNVSRLLRGVQSEGGSRTYVTLCALSSSAQERDRLKKSLCQAPADSRYQFWSFLDLSVGSKGCETSVIEARNFADRFGLTLPLFGVKGSLPAQLSPGFVFWPQPSPGPEFECDSLLLTMASILGELRSSNQISRQSSLKSTFLEKVTLDPHTFYRFNDSAIQIAILWGARSSELDYRHSQADSEAFLGLFRRWIREYPRPHGVAILDFLLAIKVKHLRLEAKKLGELLKWVTANAKTIAEGVGTVDQVWVSELLDL